MDKHEDGAKTKFTRPRAGKQSCAPGQKSPIPHSTGWGELAQHQPCGKGTSPPGAGTNTEGTGASKKEVIPAWPDTGKATLHTPGA